MPEKGKVDTIMEEKRVQTTTQKKGLQLQDYILIAVLIAAGAVLKMVVGSVVNLFGMKPNFIIAMYCLAILLVKPKLTECCIIGLLAGAVCQFLPGTAWLNFGSELLGAAVMGCMLRVPVKIKGKDCMPLAATFVSTVVSGATFTILLFAIIKATTQGLTAYIPIVLCTALINCVLVQLLYIPMKAALKR